MRSCVSIPSAHILYLGDRSWAPYGVRSLDDVRSPRAVVITDHLLLRPPDTIVLACNTASAAALTYLRALHPDRCFVGMEPAVKPAASTTRSGVVGVLATPATFQGALYASVVDRYAAGVDVVEVPCPGWMEMVEHPVDDAERQAVIERTVAPLVAAGADVLVLGCTHYPFLRSHIEAAAGHGVVVVDPGEAVARQVIRTAVPDRRSGVRIR
jgi:glutamate racemase